MPDRYYVCSIIGTGSEGNPFRAKITESPDAKRVSAVIPSNPDGTPKNDWTVCRVDANNFTNIENTEGVFRLGTRALLNVNMPQAQKDLLEEKLQGINEHIDAILDIKVKDLVLRLIQIHHPHVDEVLEAFP